MIPVIIINWNGLEDTVECVDSILTLSDDNFIIYLIDNHSTQDDYLHLQKKYGQNEKIKLFRNDQNIGFAKAHLKIWEDELIHLDCEYIALINNDTVVENTWLMPLVKAAKDQNAHVISCKLIDYFDRGLMDNAGHEVITTGEIVPVAHDQSIDVYTESFSNSGACGGACLYDKKMLEEIGFFDSYFDTGYEDAELGLRAITLGYKAIYCPESVVYHKGGRSIKKVFDATYAIRNQRNILYTFFKLFPLPQVVIYYPINLIRSFLIIIVSFLFLRLNYVRILTSAHIQFLNSDISKALKARKKLFSGHKRVNPLFFFLRQKSFITFGLGRLYSHLILRKPSALDKYR